MVPSLFSLCQQACMRLAAQITDVGDTPYHLVAPILRRLNAKQLVQVEDASPHLAPASDELWEALIRKDFPDRPLSPGTKLQPGGEWVNMPNKNVYHRYAAQKALFLALLAERLRTMTERLQREKAKNSIVSVAGVIADPTIRRRSGQRRAQGPAKPTLILGKAKRDVRDRLFMFRAQAALRSSNVRPAWPRALSSPSTSPQKPVTRPRIAYSKEFTRPDTRLARVSLHANTGTLATNSNARTDPSQPLINHHRLYKEFAASEGKTSTEELLDLRRKHSSSIFLPRKKPSHQNRIPQTRVEPRGAHDSNSLSNVGITKPARSQLFSDHPRH